MPPERSRHQEKIIKRYYRNLDAIALQRSQELVTELFLSEGKKRAQIWKRLEGHLEKVGLPADRIAHLKEKDDPTLVANELSRYSS